MSKTILLLISNLRVFVWILFNIFSVVSNAIRLPLWIIPTLSHNSSAEELCDRVGIIHKGNLIALDTTENMLNKIQTKTLKFEINKRIVLDNINDKNYNILINTDSEFKIEYNKQVFLSLIHISEPTRP